MGLGGDVSVFFGDKEEPRWNTDGRDPVSPFSFFCGAVYVSVREKWTLLHNFYEHRLGAILNQNIKKNIVKTDKLKKKLTRIDAEDAF